MVSPRHSADPSTPAAPVETPLTPQLARSLIATQNAWTRLEAQYGLLTSDEVATLLGLPWPTTCYSRPNALITKSSACSEVRNTGAPGSSCPGYPG
jgi:hypothetical protein